MTRVYPNAANAFASSVSSAAVPNSVADHGNSPVVLTIWKKSLLFNCNVFTLFDDQGNLVFRVDNYNTGTKEECLWQFSSHHPPKGRTKFLTPIFLLLNSYYILICIFWYYIIFGNSEAKPFGQLVNIQWRDDNNPSVVFSEEERQPSL